MAITNYSGYNPQTGSYSSTDTKTGTTKSVSNFGNFINYSNPKWTLGDTPSGNPTPAPGEDPAVTAARIAADAQAASDAAAAQLAAQQRDYERQQRYNATSGLLKQMFSQYGLESLFPQVEAWARMDLTADEIIVNLRKTQEYNTRFPAMQTLMKEGRAISEAEYMAYEDNARKVEKLYGLPAGMVSGSDAVANLLIKSVSGQELESRVVMAADSMYKMPKEMRDQFRNYYGVDSGGLTAYFLDPDRAMPLLQKQYVSSQIGTEAALQDVQIQASMAEELYGQGIDQAQARRGFQQVGQRTELMYGRGDTVTQEGLIKGTFGLDAQATTDVARAAASRVARFAGGGTFVTGSGGVSGLGSGSR